MLVSSPHSSLQLHHLSEITYKFAIMSTKHAGKSGTNQDSQFQLSFNPYRRKCQKQAEGSAQIRDRQQSGTASLSLLLNMRTHTAHIPTGLPLHLHSQMVSPHNAALQTPQLVRSIKHKVPTIRGRFTPYMKLPRCRDS